MNVASVDPAALAEVVDYYNRGGVKNPSLSERIQPLGLTTAEQAALIEFLKALTGVIDPDVDRPPELPN